MTPQQRGPHHEAVMDMLSTERMGFQAIASQLGISRERVRQIARSNGYQGNRRRERIPCKAHPICPICRQGMRAGTKAATSGHQACKRAANVVSRTCANCGKPKTMPLRVFRGSLSLHTRRGLRGPKLWYCDKRCLGQAQARENGWGTPRQVLCHGCGLEFTGWGARAKWCAACNPHRAH